MTQESPLVSIVCITYNHAPYIKRALDAMLAQNTTFQFEIVLADDCSTDGTTDTCKAYAEKYPYMINLLPRTHNLGSVENEADAVAAATGKYIAFCEGDDYWTDVNKLQKQVDFLEANPEYSVCFTRYNIQNLATGEVKPGYAEFLFDIKNSDCDGEDVSMNTAMNVWCTQYLTLVCRKDCYDNTLYKKYRYFRDTHQVYHLMLKGKCRMMNFIGGVYCITGGGEHSHRDYISQQQMTLAVDSELWKNNNDIRWRNLCVRVMQDLIDHYDGRTKMVFLRYALNVFRYRGGVGKFIRNIKVICF